MSKIGLIVAAVLAGSVIAVGFSAWSSLAAVEMSTGGIIAMILGGIATLGLGVGLMGLVFWSNRKGFDDAAGAAPTAHNPADHPET